MTAGGVPGADDLGDDRMVAGDAGEDERRLEAALRPRHLDRKSTRLNSSHSGESRMPSSA